MILEGPDGIARHRCIRDGDEPRVGVGITCELLLGDVPVVRCSWRDLRVSCVRGAVR